jgi:hypothetical protein
MADYSLKGWKLWWSRHLGWFPIQFCHVCGKAYWGGLPRWWWVHHLYWIGNRSVNLAVVDRSEEKVDFWKWGPTWMPSWADYCSKKCCDIEMDFIGEHGVTLEEFLDELRANG